MLDGVLLVSVSASFVEEEVRTTWRASLRSCELAVNERYCVREAMRTGRSADRKMKGVILEAIVAVLGRNG